MYLNVLEFCTDKPYEPLIGAYHPVADKNYETRLHSPREHAVQHDILAKQG